MSCTINFQQLLLTSYKLLRVPEATVIVLVVSALPRPKKTLFPLFLDGFENCIHTRIVRPHRMQSLAAAYRTRGPRVMIRNVRISRTNKSSRPSCVYRHTRLKIFKYLFYVLLYYLNVKMYVIFHRENHQILKNV